MKSLLMASLLSSLLVTALQASDSINYLDMGTKVQNTNKQKQTKSTTLVVHTGIASLYHGAGVELEGSMSLQNIEDKERLINDTADYWTVGMYSTYIWELGNVRIKPRVGLHYENVALNTIKTNSKRNRSQAKKSTSDKKIEQDTLGVSAGIGLTYQLGNHANVYTNFTRYEDDANHLTFGAEYRF